jgi:hypothetical protein
MSVTMYEKPQWTLYAHHANWNRDRGIGRPDTTLPAGWKRFYMIGETPRSWVLSESPTMGTHIKMCRKKMTGKVDGYTVRFFWSMDDGILYEERYSLAEEVRFMTDIETLKKVAELLGYDVRDFKLVKE